MTVETIATNSTVVTNDKLSDLSEAEKLGAKLLVLRNSMDQSLDLPEDYVTADNKNFHLISQAIIKRWVGQEILPDGYQVVPASSMLAKKFLEQYIAGWAGSTFTEGLKKLHAEDGLPGVACRLQHSWVLQDPEGAPVVCLEFIEAERFMLWGNTTGIQEPQDVLKQKATVFLIKWLAVHQSKGKAIVFKGPGAVTEAATAQYKELYEAVPLEKLIHKEILYQVFVKFSPALESFKAIKQEQFKEAMTWFESVMSPLDLQAIKASPTPEGDGGLKGSMGAAASVGKFPAPVEERNVIGKDKNTKDNALRKT